jgi:hypothetical protein
MKDLIIVEKKRVNRKRTVKAAVTTVFRVRWAAHVAGTMKTKMLHNIPVIKCNK